MRQLNVELWFLFRINFITFFFFYNFWHPNGKKSNCFWIYICHARLLFDFIQYNNTTNVEMLQCKVAELQQYQLLIKGTIAIQTVNVTKRANRTKLATGIRNQIEVSYKWASQHIICKRKRAIIVHKLLNFDELKIHNCSKSFLNYFLFTKCN